MRTEIFKISGMNCVSCASIIERDFKKTNGVISADVNYGTETLKVSFDEKIIGIEVFSEKVKKLGYSIIPQSVKKNENALDERVLRDKEKLVELNKLKFSALSALPLAVFAIFVMSWEFLARLEIVVAPSFALKEFFHHWLPIFAVYALFVIGKPYLLGAYRFIRFGKADMNSLIGLGSLTAFLYSAILSSLEGLEENLENFINIDQTYFDVTIVVIAFITLGKYLEARSKMKTGDAIEKLLHLQAKTALVIRDGKEIEISAEQIQIGELIRVKPAEIISTDGILIEGDSFVDESIITGEPMPIFKNIGNKVVGGTLNTTGSFIFKAEKIGKDTMLSRIIKMVETAQASKASIQALADKISAMFVPVTLAIAFLSFGIWLLIGTNYIGFSQALAYGLMSFVGVLVIACPCALGLATPMAIIVGVGKGALNGILIKNAETLEKLCLVNAVVMDKTGTLTNGKPEVTDIQIYSDIDKTEALSILVALEKQSEHPIALSILNYAKKNNTPIYSIKTFKVLKGRGVKGIVNEVEYNAGNVKFARENGIDFDAKIIEEKTKEGKTPVILFSKKKILAVVFIADTIKKEAVETIKKLRELKIKTIMLTGDNKNTADYIAKQIGIDEVFAEILPEYKLNKIKDLQMNGNIVAMVGDGINDAPALAQADIGIAMATGTDAAIESAGVTLLNGDISKIVKTIRLSRLTMNGVKQNLFWAFVYNLFGIPLAAGVFYPFFGWLLNPVFAGLAMAFSSVSVVANSLRLKIKKL